MRDDRRDLSVCTPILPASDFVEGAVRIPHEVFAGGRQIVPERAESPVVPRALLGEHRADDAALEQSSKQDDVASGGEREASRDQEVRGKQQGNPAPHGMPGAATPSLRRPSQAAVWRIDSPARTPRVAMCDAPANATTAAIATRSVVVNLSACQARR